MTITPDTLWTIVWRRAEVDIRNWLLKFSCEIKVAVRLKWLEWRWREIDSGNVSG